MVSTEAIYIGGSVAIGAAIMGILFLVYPDLMFPKSDVSSPTAQGGVAPVSPQDTMTAGDTSAAGSGNSTNGSTGGTTAPYAPTMP